MTTPLRRLQTAAAIATIAIFAGCSNSDNDDDLAPPPATVPDLGVIEVIHASADAPPVRVLMNDSVRIDSLDYKEGTALPTITGTYAVEVQGLLPGDTTVTVIPAGNDPRPELTLEEGVRISVIALGDVATIAPKVLIDESPEVAAGTVRLRVLHAAPDVIGPGNSAVQVWLTNPGADIEMPAATDTVITAVFEFDDLLTVDPLEVDAGDYQVRVTPPGDPATVAYDSGTITLPGGANLIIAAVPNTTVGAVGPNASPISLIASTGAGMLEFLDINTPSTVRAVHASSDAPAVDILVDGAVVWAAVPFEGTDPANGDGVRGPAALDAGTTQVDIAISPFMAGDTPVLSATPELVQGAAATALAIGSAGLDPDNPIALLLLNDSVRTIATEAQVRIVHASVVAQDVDIYVLPENSLLAAADIPDDIDPLLTDVPFGAETGYLSLAEGNYDIAVTPAGDKTPAIGPLLGVPFNASTITTIVALDGTNLTTPLGVLILDDTL